MPSKSLELQLLYSHVKAYGIPTDWKILVAESSIVMTNPRRTRVVKIDSNRTLTVDYIKGFNVKSVVTQCGTVVDVWEAAEKVLNVILKRQILETVDE